VTSWLAHSTSEWPGFEPWPGSLCYVPEQDALLSQCLSQLGLDRFCSKTVKKLPRIYNEDNGHNIQFLT